MSCRSLPTFGLFTFILLCICVCISYAALPPKDPASRQIPERTPITLEEVLAGSFGARGFGGSWVPGSDNLIRSISGGNVWEYNVATEENTTIAQTSDFTDYLGQDQPLAGLTFAADRRYILIEHSRRSLWRHSFLAKYDIYDSTTKTFTKLVPNDEPVDPQPELQLVLWSPSGNSLAFVFGNNIYYKKSPTEPVVKITKDGDDAIFNGISDWVYEEEMFGSPVACWFSKDSSNLAFVKFNDANVQMYEWPIYGEPGVRETVYPKYEPIRYPKSGTENPEVSMNIVDLNAPEVIQTVKYPDGQDPRLQYYIATAIWATNTDLILVNLNRAQNQSTWHLCKTDATCSEIYSQSQKDGWIDAHTPTISDDGTKFLTLQPVPQVADSNRSYTHIVSVDISTSISTPVTSGVMSVDSILGWDEKNNKIYFSGTGLHSNVNDPSENHIYFVQSTNTSPNCITCTQKNTAGEDCRSNSASFSADFTYFTHSCRGPGIPEIITKKTENSETVKTWVDNNELRTTLFSKAVPSTQDYEFTLSSGFVAKIRLYLPPNFDDKQKYPLLIDVYAGPDSQKINQDYKVDWGTYLASSKGVIYGSIDARGSGRQSAELKFSLYRNLGSAEIEDQIEATKYLVGNHTFIDATKTAIWGWSYGGYATAMVLGKDLQNVFRCGVSVAPVSSWLYYDTIYTERYMGLPSDEDNWVNYNAGSVMNHVENFKNKQFLLIHGNADDNVHYQQSMMLARALEKADVMFDQLSYPEENHSINGPYMRRHLYHSIERFLNRSCFSPFEQSPSTTDSGNKGGASSFNINFYILALTAVITTFYTRC